MFMHPSVRVRKGLITEPTSTPFINYPDSVCIQDDQCFPDFSQEASLQYIDQQQQSRLQSPFQYHTDLQFVSPPSSAPSSPTSSPASSISHHPATTALAADYPCAVFDGLSEEAPSMTPASSYNPSIHIQHSASPPASQHFLPQYPQQYIFGNTSMLAQQPVANNHGWDTNLQLLSPARIQNNISRSSQYGQNSQQQHRQASPSSSSSRSAPAGSLYHNNTNGTAVSKPLPTPVQTPVQNSFIATPFQNYDSSSHDVDTDTAMRRAVMEQRQKQQQQQQQQQHHHRHQHQTSDYSLAPSVSSVSHNSPVTPQASFEELDDPSKTINDYGVNNTNNMSVGIPKLNRTISDIYQDELYNPTIMPTPQVSKPATNNQQQNLLTPYRSVFADRLQAANQVHISARSQSPTSGMRERSPFRPNSPMASEYVQQPAMSTSMPAPQNLVNVRQGQNQGESNTMSPKDALLDFNEGDDSGLPLFPSNQPDFNLGDSLGLRRESSSSFPSSQNFVSMESFPGQYATHAVPQFPFAQPQQPQQQHQQQQQELQQQQQQNNMLHQTPEFPASLPHFESTESDILPSTEIPSPQPQAKIAIQPINEEITRPDNTSSNSGTYTCTYHGCSLRFDTPAKLQKHKREAHRQTTPGGHLVGRDTSSRNSQAGPHKCERINPSTGKPCNSIFSRPYDLTRHEDTIHNARKQKVRCHLCTEEKTFSRNDALTRHMRVVHPEVDWPGKQRRKGRE